MEPTPASFLLQPPVFHPVLPYITTIFGGVYHGKMIVVQGTVPNDAERFQVDFQYGCSVCPRANIAFHFNPRFHSSPHVICNTLDNERWQGEKKCSKLPIKPGDHFQLLFRFEQTGIKVSVSGRHFVEYLHRLPMECVDTLMIFGDVMIKVIGFINSNPFAEDQTEYPICEPFLLDSPSLRVPYACQLTESLRPGKVVRLRGLVTSKPDTFNLSFSTDAAVLVSLKLLACFEDQSVRCSSFLGQAWEPEEKLKLKFFPFYPERFFEILLLCEAQRFKIAINGMPIGEYSPPHLDLKQISHLQISGDVKLYSIQC